MKAPSAVSTPISPRKRRENKGASGNQAGHSQSRASGRNKGGKGREGGAGWIWGAHACIAALANPKRTIHQIMMTEAAQSRYTIGDGAPLPKIVMPGMLDKQFDNTAHQGIAMKCAPLEWPALVDICEHAADDALILVLDQITDPHNVGAMLRLCSTFGVSALVMQDRNAPPMAGATAKVAVGCVESVPVCRVTNIANTLDKLKAQDFMVTGLAGDTELTLSQVLSPNTDSKRGRHAIVMGAEGPGLRERVMKTCDQLAKIPMMSSNKAGEAESLNVATAAGIALYEARRN